MSSPPTKITLPGVSAYTADYFGTPSADEKRKSTADKKTSGLKGLLAKKKSTDTLSRSSDTLPRAPAAAVSAASSSVAAPAAVAAPNRGTARARTGSDAAAQKRRLSANEQRLSKSELDTALETLAPAGSITQFALKMESGGRTIPVGQPPKVAQERKFLGVPLGDLATRDGRLVPRLVSDCVKWLWQNGMVAGVFVVDCDAERVDALIARVEKGLYETLYEEAAVDCALVTTVLKRFLHASSPADECVFTNALRDKLCTCPPPTPAECAALLISELPPPNYAIVELLLPLLHEISVTARCAMGAAALADALAPVLLNSKGALVPSAAAQEALRVLVAEWPAVLLGIDACKRQQSGADVADAGQNTSDAAGDGSPDSDSNSSIAASGGGTKDFNSLFEVLDSVGLMQHFELFKHLGVALDDFRGMQKEELLGLGMDDGDAQLLLLAAARHSPQKTSPGGGAATQSGETEPVWEGDGLDPRVAKFLDRLGLSALRELFEQFEIDWTILDMSSAADLKELGLDERTVTAIMHGMGKDPKIGSGELMVQPIAVTDTGQLELKSSLLGVQPAGGQGRLAPDMIVDLREIRVQKKIGIGGYAEVWKAQWRGRTVAFKLLQEETMEQKRVVDEFRLEMITMAAMDHPNIVAFYGAVDHGRSLAMILEYAARGDLEGLLLDHKAEIPYLQRLRWAKQVAQGLHYLHTRTPRVIHRDIKSANVLVDELLCTKICDFGLAKRHVSKDMPNEMRGVSGALRNQHVLNIRSAAVQFTTLVGTPAWTAPELIANRSYSEKVDVYSFGVFLWELMCRQTPHEGMAHFDLAYQILSNNLRPAIPVWMPPTFAQLMKSCWSSKPEFRPSIDIALKVLTMMLANPRHDEVKLPF